MTFHDPHWWEHPGLRTGVELALSIILTMLAAYLIGLYMQKFGSGGKWLIAAKLRGETRNGKGPIDPVVDEPFEIPRFTYGLDEIVKRMHEQDELPDIKICEDKA